MYYPSKVQFYFVGQAMALVSSTTTPFYLISLTDQTPKHAHNLRIWVKIETLGDFLLYFCPWFVQWQQNIWTQLLGDKGISPLFLFTLSYSSTSLQTSSSFCFFPSSFKEKINAGLGDICVLQSLELKVTSHFELSGCNFGFALLVLLWLIMMGVMWFAN